MSKVFFFVIFQFKKAFLPLLASRGGIKYHGRFMIESGSGLLIIDPGYIIFVHGWCAVSSCDDVSGPRVPNGVNNYHGGTY